MYYLLSKLQYFHDHPSLQSYDLCEETIEI